MEENFFQLRLSKLNKDELVQEIVRNKTRGLFSNYNEAQLQNMNEDQLRALILSTPNYQWDIMFTSDYLQYQAGKKYDEYIASLSAQWEQRVKYYESLTRDQLIEIMQSPYNSSYNPFDVFTGNNPRINRMSREDILNHFKKEPRYTIPGQAPGSLSNPNYWTPKPTQVEHIENLIKGLTHPLNDYRFALDGSAPGRGKTIAGSLVAKGLKVANILVVAPLQVVKKWHDSLSKMFPPYNPMAQYNPNIPSGRVRFRVMNYEGLSGGNNQTKPTKKNPIPPTVKWARYRDNMDDLSEIRDNDWIQLRKDPNDPNAKFRPDWSFLPSDVPGGEGISGTLVIFDEIHAMKNITSADRAMHFSFLIKYLSDLNVASEESPLDPYMYQGDRNPHKYVRVLGLSGSIIENMKDLTYIARALGIIDKMERSALDLFKSKVLVPRFLEIVPREERRDWHRTITDTDKKLLVYFRALGRYKNNFSQIPDPVDYILYRVGILNRPYPEDRNEFLTRIFSTKFQELMGTSFNPAMNDLSVREKLNAFLLHLAKDSRYAELQIENYVNPFKNMLTFQAIKIQPEDLASFAKVNRDITKIISDYEQSSKKGGGILGQIQRAISQLEAYKLVPFYELATYALGLTLENGARPSVVIASNRVNTVRILSWQIEAYLEIQARIAQGWTNEQWNYERQRIIYTIMSKQQEYNEQRSRRKPRDPFPIKETFGFKSQQELMTLPWPQLMTEYNKWVIYLNVNDFQHVCVLVGNFGVPGKKDEDYDPEEGELMDNLKDSAPLSNDQKDRAKELFQANERKVILATMAIGSLGIDLMDTSVGGMHPRVMVSSPGIIANVLLQMRKRIVREGQTSETFAMFAYVGDSDSLPSWEARLMRRVATKVKNIQMLHDGEVSVDIKDDDGEGEKEKKFFDVLKEIRDKEMNSTNEKERGVAADAIKKILSDALEGKGEEERLEDRYKKTTEFASQAKTITAKVKPSLSGANDNNAPLFKLTVVFGYNYFGVIVDDALDASKFDQIKEGFSRMLNEYMFKAGEVIASNYFYPKMAFVRGFLGIMDRLRVLGVSPGDFVKLLQDRVPNDVQVQMIDDGNDNNFILVDPATMKRFDTTLKIDTCTVAFVSQQEIVVAPAYPLLSKISASLLGNDLRTEPFQGKFYMGSKFMGEPHKMVAIYFAIIVAFKQYKGVIFNEFIPLDGTGIRRDLFIKNYFKVEQREKGSFWVAPKDLFVLTEVIFFGSPLLREAGMNNIFDFAETDINQATGIYAIKIKQEFVKVLTDLSKEFMS